MLNLFLLELVQLVEQIFTDLNNLKLKFDFGATPTMSENEDFSQRGLEIWEVYYYYGNIKTWTVFFDRLVVCSINMQSFK